MSKAKEIIKILEYEYTVKIDPIIYGELTNKFDEDDWIDLAIAALDQADFSREAVDSFIGKERK